MLPSSRSIGEAARIFPRPLGGVKVGAGESMGMRIRAEFCRARRCEFIRTGCFFHRRCRMYSALQPVIVSHLAKVSKIRVRENLGSANNSKRRLEPAPGPSAVGVTLALSDSRKNPG